MKIFNDLTNGNYNDYNDANLISDPNPVSVSATEAFEFLSSRLSDRNRYVLGFLPFIREVHFYRDYPEDFLYEYAIIFDNQNSIGPLLNDKISKLFEKLYLEYKD